MRSNLYSSMGVKEGSLSCLVPVMYVRKHRGGYRNYSEHAYNFKYALIMNL